MPYIPQSERDGLDPSLGNLISALQMKGFKNGHIAYCVYRIMKAAFLQAKSYDSATMIRSNVENTVSEFYRRIVAPYEDEKIKENGDV